MLSVWFTSIRQIFLPHLLPWGFGNPGQIPTFALRSYCFSLIHLMKKKLFFFLFCIFSTAAVFAQDEPESNEPEPMPDAPTRNFRIGVRTGAAVSTVNPGNLVNPSLLFGLTGGMTLRYKFGKIHDDRPEAYRFGFETQLNFVYKGSNFKNQNTEYYKMSFFYADMPLYGIVKIDKPGHVKLLAGPYSGYLINRSIYIKPDTYQDSTKLKLKSFDYGVAVGLEFKTRPVGFQVIVKQGLRDINDGLNAVNYPLIKPAFNGGRIRNFSVEIVLSF